MWSVDIDHKYYVVAVTVGDVVATVVVVGIRIVTHQLIHQCEVKMLYLLVLLCVSFALVVGVVCDVIFIECIIGGGCYCCCYYCWCYCGVVTAS